MFLMQNLNLDALEDQEDGGFNIILKVSFIT
jgi:hypothetical protein